MSAPRTSPSSDDRRDLERRAARVSGSPLDLVDDDARQHGDEDARDLRERSRAARRRASDARYGRRKPSRRTNVRQPRLRRASRVVVGHGFVGYGSCSRPCPTSPRGETPAVVAAIGEAFARRRDAARRPLRRRPQPLGVHARRRRGRRSSSRCSPGSRSPSSSSTCASTSASTRASASPTSSRSSRSRPTDDARARSRPRARLRAESATSSGSRSSSTARSAGGRRPAFFRRGGLDELRRRVDAGELVPDDGPREIDPRSGAVLVGARHAARRLQRRSRDGRRRGRRETVAAAVRESSGGMPGVQAIGLRLPGSGRDAGEHERDRRRRAPLHEVVERVRRRGRAHAASEVRGGELVGLVPERVVARRRGGRSRASGGRRVAGARDGAPL